jgi:hypothetical protein
MSATVTLPANCDSAQVFVHTESATHIQTMTPATSVGGGVFSSAVTLPPEDRVAPEYFEALLTACRGGANVAEAVCGVIALIPEPVMLLASSNICALAFAPTGELGFPACMLAFKTASATCEALELPEGAEIEALCDIAEDVQKYLSERGEPQYPLKLWATAKTDGQQGWSTSDRTSIARPVGEMSLWIDGAQCCELNVSSQQLNVAAQGGPVALQVRANDPTCPWSVVAGSSATWVTPAPLSGVGTGEVLFTVAENQGDTRVAPFSVAGKTVAVAQAAAPTTNPPPPPPTQPPPPPQPPKPSCVVKLGASRQELPSTGGRSSFAVEVAAGCRWSATSSAPWLKLVDSSGVGPGTIVYQADPNTGAAARSATITVEGEKAEIVQASQNLTCFYGTSSDLAPKVSASGGRTLVKVVSSSSILCPVVAPVTGEPWITLSPITPALDGSYEFTYSVAVNPGAARRGWLRLANITIAIEQAGVAAQPPPPSGDACEGLAFAGGDVAAVGAVGATASASVSAPAKCSWAVSSVVSSQTDPWLSATRNGNVIQYNAKQNSTGAKRAGFITIKSSSGKVVRRLVVMQEIFSWMACRFGFSPWNEVDAPAEGLSRTIEINANSSLCDARVVPPQLSDPWVSASPLSNVIPGRWTMNIGVGSNPGTTARDGFLIVMDAVFKIHQAGKPSAPPPPPREDPRNPPENPPPCTYGVSPTTITAPQQGGKFVAQVTASCTWRAAISPAGWLEMAPVSGTGSTPVTIFIPANRGANRSGTITFGSKVITINQQGTVVAPLPPPKPPTPPTPPTDNGGSCGTLEPSRTRPRFVSGASLPADGARGIAIACPSGDVMVAGQRGSSAVIAKLDASLAARGWLVNREGLDVRGLAVPRVGEPAAASAVYAAGIATLGQCGAHDGVGDPEGKSVLSIFNAATGAEATCGSQTIFPYSGYEQHWAIAATHNAVFTTGLYETCGFGHYVNVLTHYDLAGNVVGRASEPGVDFGGYSCIGSSVGNAIASADGSLFIAGSSALSGEGASRAFLARSAGLARSWKTRSTVASDFAAVAWDAGAVYAAGVCSGQACIEKFDAAHGTSLWTQTYGPPGSRISGIVAPGNGHIYAVGFSEGGSADALLIDVAGSTGAQASIDVYDSGGKDAARSVVSNGSNLYVLGDTAGQQAGVFVRRYQLESPQDLPEPALPDTSRLSVFVNGVASGGIYVAGKTCIGSDSCSWLFNRGETVTISADVGGFTGWSGSCRGASNPCTLVMDIPHHQVGAGIGGKQPPPLPDPPSPEGMVRVSIAVAGGPGGIYAGGRGCVNTSLCSWTFPASGESLKVSADGSKFMGWSGSCSGTGECKIALTGTHRIGAGFGTKPPTNP